MQPEHQTYRPVAPDGLCAAVAELRGGGWRLVQILANLRGASELIYSFARDEQLPELLNLRMGYEPGRHIPSVTGVYPYAFIYENELHDLFGIGIDGIGVDYHGSFYRTAERAPWAEARDGQ